jgi:hypothetical protein
MAMQIISLTSSDGENIQVNKDMAMMSETIKNLIEDVGESTQPIPIPNVDGHTLRKISQFCEYHSLHPNVDVKQYYTSGNITDPWDISFCDVPMSSKINIVNAANYLDIKSLLDTMIVSIACDIRGKTVQEMKEMLMVSDAPQQ